MDKDWTRRRALLGLAAVSGAAVAGVVSYHHESVLRFWNGLRGRRDQGPNYEQDLHSGASEGPALAEFLRQYSPIDRTLGDRFEKIYSGDLPDRNHAVLWDRSAFVERHRAQEEQGQKSSNPTGTATPPPLPFYPVVVVGAGMSGLFSAYLLRDHKPLVLEQAPRFGGNSKGESWRGIDYSIGAAYFMDQDEGSAIRHLFEELDLFALTRTKEEEDPVWVDGKRYLDFWSGESAPKAKKSFLDLKNLFENILGSKGDWTYPEMPTGDSDVRAAVNAYDGETFRAFLERQAGGSLHPHIEKALEHYCWSTFGSTIGEVSAAAGLNAYSAEFGKVYVAPGGNAALGERVLQKLAKELPLDHLRANALVVEVRVDGDSSLVTYLDQSTGRLKSVRAGAVVMACPKFVAGKILVDCEVERLEAIRKLEYRAYLVANVCISRHLSADFFDLFYLGQGAFKSADPRVRAQEDGVTDLVHASYARGGTDQTVLTLYQALPYFGGRTEVLPVESYARISENFKKQIHRDFLPLFKVNPKEVEGLRIARWGHPMPVPKQGLYQDRVVDQLFRTHKERVFFVEQDNWALAAIETCATEALRVAPEVNRLLR